jgi:hypothetical protein
MPLLKWAFVQVYCLGAGEVSTLLIGHATQILGEDGPDLSSTRINEVHNDANVIGQGIFVPSGAC